MSYLAELDSAALHEVRKRLDSISSLPLEIGAMDLSYRTPFRGLDGSRKLHHGYIFDVRRKGTSQSPVQAILGHPEGLPPTQDRYWLLGFTFITHRRTFMNEELPVSEALKRLRS